jgi:3-hydroxybutyryl-CoA dehydrogenase
LFGQVGVPVNLYDNRPGALADALNRISGNLNNLVCHGLVDRTRADEALELIFPVDTLEKAIRGVDFVTECVKEDLEVKQNLFEEMDALSPQHAVLASNTSSLQLSQIGKKVDRKSRLIITHYFNPPHIIPTVEIVCDHFTDPSIVKSTHALIARLGKVPVRLNKVVPGFLVNRIQAAMMREVLALLDQDVASPSDIDLAIRGSIGFRLAAIGPLETMDYGGLDVWKEILRNLCPELHDASPALATLSKKVENGELGVKSGRGFFDWSAQDGSGPSFAASKRDESLLKLLALFYRTYVRKADSSH